MHLIYGFIACVVAAGTAIGVLVLIAAAIKGAIG